MTSALPSPVPLDALTAWTPRPVPLLAAALLVAWYARASRATPGRSGRQAAWLLTGVAAFVWATCGFWQVYASSLFWVWCSQALLLLLLVPLLLLAGRPLDLVRPGGPMARGLATRPVRVLSNPVVGPAVIPVASFVLFFGPLPRWAVDVAPVGWLLPLLLVAVGALVVLPLVSTEVTSGSLAVGLSLGLGLFELALVSIPGLVLRLRETTVTSYFDVRVAHDWAIAPVRDQHLAGAVVWTVSEVITIPFFLLVFRRWLRADAREAAAVDAVLEAERLARPGEPAVLRPATPAGEAEVGPADVPWWVADREMQKRLGRG